ncbi:DUF4245 domain-containing protein [Curtobacterium ammoniigenes]|uniref:DUF4245 domain-containing protein n=1 Tax=Curtobacterium ammoniigenes TaxID=395387 RepID=UPI00082F41D8|nr:DUF4245 domain-containing protein [Curtobacterium ammoniigenes]
MTDQNGRPIVAELGRAETDEEAFERKSSARALRRQHQTAINLILSLVASLGIVLALVAVVGRPSMNTSQQHVDYRKIAAQAALPGVTLAAPDLPNTYWSNRADYADKTADGVNVWTVGLITPDNQYIGIHQGFHANPSWVSQQLNQATRTGTRTIAGTKWTVYDQRSQGSAAGNLAYALVAPFGDSTVILAGTADDHSFTQVASAVAAQLGGS